MNPASRARTRGRLRVSNVLALAAGVLLSGCGGYASTSEAFRKSLNAGRPDDALVAVNEALEVPDAKSLPENQGADTPLLLLERATILQSMGEYELSSRDFQTADQKLEVLDLTDDTAGDIGKYIWSDDAVVYRPPPHEKLLVNVMNLLNYLARGEIGGAKVEARRLNINAKYLRDRDGEARGMLALGSYLAGYAFEQDRDYPIAMRHYADAWEAGGVPTLSDAIQDLHARTGVGDPRVEKLTAEGREAPGNLDDTGDVLVIVQSGMAPYRTPERLPIGAAVVAATAPGPGARLSSSERRQANTFAAKGIVKWVNYPKLRKGRPGRRLNAVEVDGRGIPSGEALNVRNRTIAEFERVEGSLIAAAIVRLITRAVAGELTQAATKKASGSGALGLLAGLALEAGMTAADTPDTRSWVTLPARYYVARARVPAGDRVVRVRMGGIGRTAKINVPAGGWAVVNFSDLR
jgi:hypothetical protein